ncbi:TlpA disulfide reductase family protein [Myxococcus sp. MxC21-1]|uniref:TlpA family protein disulfide reductase n=1 Tax=Myxococcus sp. MxC21-1 TaxID=3041439 RepID=UPI00292E5C71|nr:TlpA disulfide reductase family protein [Myxococcus sp. MxC21-1]WNZ65624.1 TlpA disulfide reductase family protein [Myxococcus sp. MxC21-1]
MSLLLLGLSPLTWACKSEPPPAYVRLQGTAPTVADVPPSRALLIVFWASWCPPCRQETPQLVALAQAPPEDLQVVVFSHDETPQAVESFFKGPPPRRSTCASTWTNAPVTRSAWTSSPSASSWSTAAGRPLLGPAGLGCRRDAPSAGAPDTRTPTLSAAPAGLTPPSPI